MSDVERIAPTSPALWQEPPEHDGRWPLPASHAAGHGGHSHSFAGGYNAHGQGAGGADGSAGEGFPPPHDEVDIMGLDFSRLPAEARAAVKIMMAEIDRLYDGLQAAEGRLARLEQDADLFPGTSLLCQRAFVRELEAFIQQGQSSGLSGSLALFFMENHDAFYRHEGAMLSASLFAHSAAILADSLRASDRAGVLAPTVLAVLLTGAGPEQANGKAERLLTDWSNMPLMVDGRACTPSFVHAIRQIFPADTAAGVIADADNTIRRQLLRRQL